MIKYLKCPLLNQSSRALQKLPASVVGFKQLKKSDLTSYDSFNVLVLLLIILVLTICLDIGLACPSKIYVCSILSPYFWKYIL